MQGIQHTQAANPLSVENLSSFFNIIFFQASHCNQSFCYDLTPLHRTARYEGNIVVFCQQYLDHKPIHISNYRKHYANSSKPF